MQNPFQIGDHHVANPPLHQSQQDLNSDPALKSTPPSGISHELEAKPDTRHDHTAHTVCQGCQINTIWIRAAYVLAILFWLGLVIFLGFQPCWLLDWVLILLPIFLFAVAITTAGHISPYVELWTLRSSTISNVVILIFPILVWATARVDNTTEFLLLVLTATGLSVVSLLDLWVTEPYLNVIKHLRSICQTLSIVLTLLALVQYYKDRKRDYDKKVILAATASCRSWPRKSCSQPNLTNTRSDFTGTNSTNDSTGDFAGITSEIETIEDVIAAALV